MSTHRCDAHRCDACGDAYLEWDDGFPGSYEDPPEPPGWFCPLCGVSYFDLPGPCYPADPNPDPPSAFVPFDSDELVDFDDDEVDFRRTIHPLPY